MWIHFNVAGKKKNLPGSSADLAASSVTLVRSEALKPNSGTAVQDVDYEEKEESVYNTEHSVFLL